MLIGVAEEERNFELTVGWLVQLPGRKEHCKPEVILWGTEVCVRTWILAMRRKRNVAWVDYVASQWVGLLHKCRGSAWYSGKGWGFTHHFRSWFEFCDHLLSMSSFIFYLTFLSFSSLIWKNRNNETYSPSLISLSVSRTNPQANWSKLIDPLERGKPHIKELWDIAPDKGKDRLF